MFGADAPRKFRCLALLRRSRKAVAPLRHANHRPLCGRIGASTMRPNQWPCGLATAHPDWEPPPADWKVFGIFLVFPCCGAAFLIWRGGHWTCTGMARRRKRSFSFSLARNCGARCAWRIPRQFSRIGAVAPWMFGAGAPGKFEPFGRGLALARLGCFLGRLRH